MKNIIMKHNLLIVYEKTPQNVKKGFFCKPIIEKFPRKPHFAKKS